MAHRLQEIRRQLFIELQGLTSNRVMVSLGLAFLISACLTAFVAFLVVRSFVANWASGDVPGLSTASQGGGALAGSEIDINTPLQPATGPTPQTWDGTGRVNVLVMGMDYRDWELDQGPPRTDTMLLLSLDPVSRTAGILSIPRDLWVNIPGFQAGKINTAYRLGEVYQAPGGGPGVAIQTVEGLLGVPINYYAMIDFYSFVRLIDELGGIEVNVPEEIWVDPLGPGNTQLLLPGPNTLDGETALAYARNRDTLGGDFDRATRQQQVIMAIRDKVLSLDTLTLLISRAPVLYQEISQGIQTNLSLDETIKLAYTIAQLPAENIQRAVIGPDQVTSTYSYDGQDILLPIPDQIRILRDQLFSAEEPGGPAVVPEDPAELMGAEAARVSVLNGTFTPGLASQTTEYLKSQGVNVTFTGNAAQSYTQTMVIDYTGKPYTIQYLVNTLNISPDRIFNRFDLESQVDVEVNLGSDWSTNFP